MAILGNQGYRRDLNLGETESEIEVINNLGGAGIAADLRLIQNNLRNTSKIGFCTITDGFFNTGISTVIQLSELSKTIQNSALTDFSITLDPPQYIEAGHQVEIRNIQKSDTDTSPSVLNGFYYVNQVINDGQQYKFAIALELGVITEGGTGYTSSESEVSTTTTGAGTGLKVNTTVFSNAVIEVSIHTPGTGYVTGDEITISSGNNNAKFIIKTGNSLGSENPVIVNNATDGFSTVRITPRDSFTFTKDDVVGLSSDVTFQIEDPGEPGFTTTLTKGRDYYVCNSDGLSKFKLSYFPSGYSSNDGSQVGIQTIDVTGIDYASSPTQFFTFIRKNIVTQENLLNFIKPDEGTGGDIEESGFRFFRTSDDPDVTSELNGVLVTTSSILDQTRFSLDARYEKTKSISSTKDIKYEGAVIIKDPDNLNGGSNNVKFNPKSPGIFIAGTRAFSADNNPWTDEDEIADPVNGVANAIVTKSFQASVAELAFEGDIRIDGLGNDIGTINKTAGSYTHKVPVVVNGETYFLLLIAN